MFLTLWYKEKDKYIVVDLWSIFFLNLSLHIGDKQKLFYLVAG